MAPMVDITHTTNVNFFFFKGFDFLKKKKII